jgi:hypothetical protein
MEDSKLSVQSQIQKLFSASHRNRRLKGLPDLDENNLGQVWLFSYAI